MGSIAVLLIILFTVYIALSKRQEAKPMYYMKNRLPQIKAQLKKKKRGKTTERTR